MKYEMLACFAVGTQCCTVGSVFDRPQLRPMVDRTHLEDSTPPGRVLRADFFHFQGARHTENGGDFWKLVVEDLRVWMRRSESAPSPPVVDTNQMLKFIRDKRGVLSYPHV